MPPSAEIVEINGFVAITLGIVVYFIGAQLTRRIDSQQKFNSPEPVSGGLFAALITLGYFLLSGREGAFDLFRARRITGLFLHNDRVERETVRPAQRRSDPRSAVRPDHCVHVCAILVGMLGATFWGLPPKVGVMMGTAALIGGHGTAIACGPVVAKQDGVVGAVELGSATATLAPMGPHAVPRR